MAPVMIPSPTTPTATTTDPMPDTLDLDGIATTVEHRGVAAVDPRHIVSLVAQARAAGASQTLIDVLQGSSEPAVARVRAFGRIAAVLISGQPRVHTAAVPGMFGTAVPQPR